MSQYILFNAPVMAHLLTFQETPPADGAKTSEKPADSAAPTMNAADNKTAEQQTTPADNKPIIKVEPKNGPANPPPPTFWEVMQSMAPMMLVVFAIYYFMIARPEQEARKKMQDNMEGMKKNDVVVTYGGIFGTIHDFSADGKEVILKLEENAKIRVRKSSIESVIKAPANPV